MSSSLSTSKREAMAWKLFGKFLTNQMMRKKKERELHSDLTQFSQSFRIIFGSIGKIHKIQFLCDATQKNLFAFQSVCVWYEREGVGRRQVFGTKTLMLLYWNSTLMCALFFHFARHNFPVFTRLLPRLDFENFQISLPSLPLNPISSLLLSEAVRISECISSCHVIWILN